MKHLRHFARAALLALVVALNAHGLTLAVQSWNVRRDVTCDLVGAPVVVVDACRDAVWVTSWGMQ